MDLINNLSLGFSVAFTMQNLMYAFIGCFLGTLIGVLPGVGPVATIAMLLPATYALPPVAALIMLAGIYYGAQYGGSTTAILVNLPGESSSVVTVIDGYQMARKGRAGPALAAAGLGSFFAGCVGTLILAVYKQAADYLLEDGASPYEIDAAVRGFGFAMGPFQVTDLAGGDIGWATRKRRAATRDPKARYVEIADRICERGWFGQKTGRGFYLYPDGARTGQPDPEVLAIVDSERAKKGITPRSFTADDIMRRYMAAMVNEGATVVHEGIALRPLDVDVTVLSGYGFPRWRGGPMKWADMTGLDKVLADIRAFEKEDPLFWKPAPLLEKLVAEGRNFDSLNKAA